MKHGPIASIVLLFVALSCASPTDTQRDNEQLYLKRIHADFIKHKEDLELILATNGKIVARLDSLLKGLVKDPADATLIKGIMNTRAYDLSIVAYKDILNGNYIHDADLKLKIATHVAMFEGFAQSKRSWDHQWDVTARPYLYANGVMSSGIADDSALKGREKNGRTKPLSDPTFRSVLFDRRMFAYDVERVTPRIMPSADSVIARIEVLLRR